MPSIVSVKISNLGVGSDFFPIEIRVISTSITLAFVFRQEGWILNLGPIYRWVSPIARFLAIFFVQRAFVGDSSTAARVSYCVLWFSCVFICRHETETTISELIWSRFFRYVQVLQDGT